MYFSVALSESIEIEMKVKFHMWTTEENVAYIYCNSLTVLFLVTH